MVAARSSAHSDRRGEDRSDNSPCTSNSACTSDRLAQAGTRGAPSRLAPLFLPVLPARPSNRGPDAPKRAQPADPERDGAGARRVEGAEASGRRGLAGRRGERRGGECAMDAARSSAHSDRRGDDRSDNSPCTSNSSCTSDRLAQAGTRGAPHAPRPPSLLSPFSRLNPRIEGPTRRSARSPPTARPTNRGPQGSAAATERSPLRRKAPPRRAARATGPTPA